MKEAVQLTAEEDAEGRMFEITSTSLVLKRRRTVSKIINAVVPDHWRLAARIKINQALWMSFEKLVV